MTHAAHVMIDIETLSLASNAAVWQVAWKDMASDATQVAFLNPAEMREHVECERLVEDPATIEWTLKTYGAHSPFASWYSSYNRGKAFGGTHSVKDLHTDMALTIGPATTVWAKGADFDFPILTNLFSWIGESAPWHYRNKACMRTLKMLAELEASETQLKALAEMKNPSAHDAGADVLHQTRQVDYYLGILNVTL